MHYFSPKLDISTLYQGHQGQDLPESTAFRKSTFAAVDGVLSSCVTLLGIAR